MPLPHTHRHALPRHRVPRGGAQCLQLLGELRAVVRGGIPEHWRPKNVTAEHEGLKTNVLNTCCECRTYCICFFLNRKGVGVELSGIGWPSLNLNALRNHKRPEIIMERHGMAPWITSSLHETRMISGSVLHMA